MANGQHGTSPPARPMAAFPPIAWAAMVASGLMMIGAFGPWIKAPLGISVSGTDGSNDGWIVVGAALVGGLAALGFARYGTRSILVLTLLAGLGGTATAWYDREDIQGRIRRTGFRAASIGWGLNLSLVASAGLALVALIGLFGNRVRWDNRPGTGLPEA